MWRRRALQLHTHLLGADNAARSVMTSPSACLPGICQRAFGTAAADTFAVAVVSPADNPALKRMPSVPGVEFIVANDPDSFGSASDLQKIQAVVFVPPANPQTLIDLWPRIPSVRWAHCFFAGVDSLSSFMPTLAEAGVPLSNGRGAFSQSLAEYVMCASLHFNKQISTIQHNKTAKVWDKFVMPVLQDKTIGFLGYGNIAQATARVAKDGFGMRIATVRRDTTKPSPYADVVYSEEDRLKLFSESDFVVSVLPGTPATLDYCGAAEFEAMKSSAVFISIGRGVAVDEDALAAALQSESIAGAAVDVFKVEPLPADSPLWDCDNLLLTAHNADYTDDYFDLGWDVWTKNYAKFTSGQDLETPVDLTTGY